MKPNTMKWLTSKGWGVDRKYDITDNVAFLSQRGWVIFEQAADFLQSFDGLGEFSRQELSDFGPYTNSFSLNSRHGFSWRPEAEILENHLGIRLYPIGYQDIYCLLIGSDKKLYAVDADITFYRLGDSTSESLDNLFNGNFITHSLTRSHPKKG